MKSKPTVGVGGVVALVFLTAAVAFIALRPGSVEMEIDHSPPVAPPEAGTAVVASLRESGGFSPFGLRITDSTHYVEVQ